jgi:hypothetical protein
MMSASTESTSFSPRFQVRSPMSKALTIVGMVVAAIVGLVFVLDLALSIPFERASVLMDVGALIAAGLLGYLSWDAMRDVR